GRHRDLDLDLGQEADGVFGAAVDFRMAPLPAVTLDFRYGEAMDAQGRECIAHFLKLEWLDDRHDDLHCFPPIAGRATGRRISRKVGWPRFLHASAVAAVMAPEINKQEGRQFLIYPDGMRYS